MMLSRSVAGIPLRIRFPASSSRYRSPTERQKLLQPSSHSRRSPPPPALGFCAMTPIEGSPEQFLFGGAISACFPFRFQDVSHVREVPDNQEVFADPSRDESLVFELLELKREVEDEGSAAWFLRDLAVEQDAENSVVLEQSGSVGAVTLRNGGAPTTVTTAVGQMAVSKGRQGREARNVVRTYVANMRLREVDTDVLITAYEPLLINPLSESASTVGAGPAVPAHQLGCRPVAEVFELAVSSFKVHNWNLFGGAA